MNDKLSYGITLVIFGVVFLLDRLGVLAQIPYGSKLLTVGVFFLIAGLVFVFTQPKRMLGWIFTAIGIFLNADIFFGWMQNYSTYIMPAVLIIGGLILILSRKKL